MWRVPLLQPTTPSAPSVTMPAIVMAVQGLFVVALGFAHSVGLTAGLVLLAGALQYAVMTACNTVLMAVVDESQRGRVSALYVTCWGGLLPIGGLLLGVIWHGAGPLVALMVSGLLTSAVAGFVLRPGARRHGVPAWTSPAP